MVDLLIVSSRLVRAVCSVRDHTLVIASIRLLVILSQCAQLFKGRVRQGKDIPKLDYIDPTIDGQKLGQPYTRYVVQIIDTYIPDGLPGHDKITPDK